MCLREKIFKENHLKSNKKSNNNDNENALLVYLEKNRKTEFLNYLERKSFEYKPTGPIHASSCNWVYVFLDTKKYIIGKPGIDFASKRYLKHAVLIEEFKAIYSIYLVSKNLNNEYVDFLNQKYKHYSVLCFSKTAAIKHIIHSIKLRFSISSVITHLICKYYYSNYNSYSKYKKKVILCLIKFHNYSREGALKDYAEYENEIVEDYKNKEKMLSPIAEATLISMNF